MKKRILLLLTVTAMLALMMALSEAALAEADVCVSIKGDPKVDKGESTCVSDPDARAVAVNGSEAIALNNTTAVAVNDSFALGVIDCTITVQNGGFDACAF